MEYFAYLCGMNEAKAKAAEWQEVFADFLTRTRRRHTPERVIVLRSAMSLKGHFTIEEVCAAVDTTGEHIALGTVYATISLMVEAGLLVRHVFGPAMLYEAAPASHSHTVCTGCGKVRDLRLPVIEQQARTVRTPRFTPSLVTVTIYGVCSTCARSAAAKKVTTRKNNHITHSNES